MNDPHDTLPICLGDTSLSQFSIRRDGCICRGIRSLQAMAIRKAAIFWNRTSGVILHQTCDEASGNATAERRKVRITDLVFIDRGRLFFNPKTDLFEPERTPTITTRWYFHRRHPVNSPTKAFLLPPDLPLAGGPGQGWYGLQIEAEYTSLVHGPSLAKFFFPEDAN